MFYCWFYSSCGVSFWDSKRVNFQPKSQTRTVPRLFINPLRLVSSFQMSFNKFAYFAALGILLLVMYLIPKQSAVHAGQIKVPPGYHPIDVEKEWGRLHVAILERERLLRTEFERWAIPQTLHKHRMSNCSPRATYADISFAACTDEH